MGQASTFKKTKRANSVDHIAAIKARVEQADRDVVDYFIQRATEYVAKDTGTLQRAIPLVDPQVTIQAIKASMSKDEAAKDIARNVSIRVPYAMYLEYGAAPHMPPVEPFRRWVRRHARILAGSKGKKTLSSKEIENIAWGIARNIEKNGMDPHPFIRPALQDARYFYAARLKQIQPERPEGRKGLEGLLARYSSLGEKMYEKGLAMLTRPLGPLGPLARKYLR